MASAPLTAPDIYSTRRIVDGTRAIEASAASFTVAYPHLVPTEQDLAAASERLEDPYHEYIRHVSPAVMAISLPTSAFVLALCERLNVRRAVDFGSGFTSYVLRLAVPDVYSVDDSPEWLVWTRRFLERHHQQTAHLCGWSDFKNRTHTPFDLAVYDFSNGQKRLDNCHYALTQVRSGGLAIMDDVQQQQVQDAIHHAAQSARCDVFGLRQWTLDTFNRYAAIAVIP